MSVMCVSLYFWPTFHNSISISESTNFLKDVETNLIFHIHHIFCWSIRFSIFSVKSEKFKLFCKTNLKSNNFNWKWNHIWIRNRLCWCYKVQSKYMLYVHIELFEIYLKISLEILTCVFPNINSEGVVFFHINIYIKSVIFFYFLLFFTI